MAKNFNHFKEVKILRIACKIKQYEFAEMLGLEQSNYCNIENGKLIPNKIEDLKIKAIMILKPYLNKQINKIKSDYDRLLQIKQQNYNPLKTK